jgi:uncharacterized protein YjbI with pentapeptide repeats
LLQLFFVYDNTEVEEMKRTIVWMFCLAIIVLLMSTGVQAKELREVSASEILKQIENGEDIFLENVRITGKLDLSKIELKTVPNARSARDIEYYGLEKELKIVESNITIRDSVFEEDVDFSNTEFRKDIDFCGTSFSGKNYFLGANFADDAYFEDANFAGFAQFEDANFADDARFWDAIFAGDAYFWNVNFAGDADFDGVNFAGDAYFEGANFAGDAYFQDANFAGFAQFEGANFAGDACFWDAIFAGNAYFWNVNFADDAYFEDANFTGNVIFSYTKFDKVYFIGTTFTNVSFTGLDYKQMNVEWSTLKDVLAYDGPAYIKLIKNFRGMEQFEDADAVYYQYRRLSQKNKKWSFSKLMDVVAGVSCGYGVKPWNAAALAVVIILIFIPIYGLRGGIRRSKENDDISVWLHSLQSAMAICILQIATERLLS